MTKRRAQVAEAELVAIVETATVTAVNETPKEQHDTEQQRRGAECYQAVARRVLHDRD
jgi:hypothetical protein